MTSNQVRTIALIDMDCFYVQVEQRDRPELWGKPVVVVQYNQFRKGGIIAVGYEARAKGIKRNGMRGADAEELCPDVTLVSVPVSRGKANLTKYRQASSQVFEVLSSFVTSRGVLVERASIDEAYVDFTQYVEQVVASSMTSSISSEADDDDDLLGDTHVHVESIGESQSDRKAVLDSWLVDAFRNNRVEDLRLAIAAKLVAEMRRAIHKQTQFRCSAGIAHNKMLAKLACGLHKPNQQTILPATSLRYLWESTKVTKVRNFGGKFGREVCDQFGVERMVELMELPRENIVAALGAKNGIWLHDVIHGIDTEPVKERDLLRSIGSGKNFMGKESLTTVDAVRTWSKSLLEELLERLEEDRTNHRRMARTLTAGIRQRSNDSDTSSTRAVPIQAYDQQSLHHAVVKALSEFNTAKDGAGWFPPVINLTLSAGRFEDCADCVQPITNFFRADTSIRPASRANSSEACTSTTALETPSHADVYILDDHSLIDDYAAGVNESEASLTQEFHDEIAASQSKRAVVQAMAEKTSSVILNSAAKRICAGGDLPFGVHAFLMKKSRTYASLHTSTLLNNRKLKRKALRPVGAAGISGQVSNSRKLTLDAFCVDNPGPSHATDSRAKSSMSENDHLSAMIDALSDTDDRSGTPVSVANKEKLVADYEFEHVSHSASGEPLSRGDFEPVSMDSVDMKVFAALPEELKLELKSVYSLRPRKKSHGAPNGRKARVAGKGIGDYFKS